MKYEKVKKNILCKGINVCNLCKKKVSGLSWDHVPPKGGLDLSDMYVRNYSELILEGETKPQVSQNGLKYRTICKECNSLLGGKYDVSFNQFMINTKEALIQNNEIQINIHPALIAKSLLGHLLATKRDSCDSKTCELIRDYIKKKILKLQIMR